MLNRAITPELIQMSKEYPVVTILGPRQAGKTTLVQATFPKKPYVNLESPEVRALAETDPHGLLSRYPNGAILDEVQRVPSLLSYIQLIVDKRKKNGLYILTGSHQLDLHTKITQSLAGRTAILTLLPLSILELSQQKNRMDDNQLMLHGFLPRIYNENQQPIKAYRHYLQTYVERDVRLLVNVKDLMAFQKFVTLCASRVGQLINYEAMSREIGVSNNTIKQWLSILEASYIVIQLQPYYANIGKRLIKTPKLYFVETGLAAYLLGIETVQQMQRDPLRGHLFENMVVMELIKSRYNLGLDHHLYFYRDQQKHEVDVVYKKANQLIPIEIKSSQTFTKSFLEGIDYFSTLFPTQCDSGYIVYAGEQSQKLGWRALLNFREAGKIVA
ncbi:MAG: AAA family ATPase [Gammaproteobacteria bacterium RIFCSPLOWO2_02_FULL_42_14]|nr:MAG: AAA family ATPase [Gammaproteobacteria bacterium RIFCSPHIGHO2_02_FULL_42_43]OGT53041.1 MAG: AAA family ATPase [Gammaproteobacteria bacterium RIFCSPHIGHO2_12_FULL_41_25]OGT61186.1 MAG: AAA family ATPase [Gammaproteobacteria bacterium RIFCSPLOWO2_02_FULL_42_14]OGT87113.1 MAG: AAA family ATPase [Gammaproteobacteria bacterium RIFCSPLOWO2_12_FULL_42_18]